MRHILNVVSVLIWLPAWLLRFVFILLGLAAVPLSLAGDGQRRTPPMFRPIWGNVIDVPEWWRDEPAEWWSYIYVPLIAFAAWHSYSNWHPLIFFGLLLASLGSVYCVIDARRWSSFWWMAIRNPTAGLASLIDQPIEEPRPNPDALVYGGDAKAAYRWLRHNLFSEYWYLRAVGKKKFEFRIGWKFADGSPGFLPTIQLRYGD